LPPRNFTRHDGGALGVVADSWPLRSTTRRIAIGLVASLCGLIISWAVARVQGRMDYSAPSLSPGEGIHTPRDLWDGISRGQLAKEGQVYAWNGWAWEERRHATEPSAWCIFRFVATPDFLERLPAQRPPYWSAVLDGLPPESFSAHPLIHHYEAGFGWPFVCLVCEVRYRALSDESEKGPRGRIVELLHGVPWRRSRDGPLLNWQWANWPWVTRSTRPPAPEVIFQFIVHDGVSRQVVSRNERYLPSRIVWMGMLANAGLYAMCFLAAAIPIRWGLRSAASAVEHVYRNTRAARARRGACRACGHPLAGLAQCPEYKQS